MMAGHSRLGQSDNSDVPAAVILEDVACPLECTADDEVVVVGRDRLHDLPGEFIVVKCRTCGLMRTNPRPTRETIHFYYPNDYGPYQSVHVDFSDGSTEFVPRWRRLVKNVIQFNTDRLPALPKGRVLEIGCASGAFLHKLANAGWDVEGLELSEQAAALARALGYPVRSGPLESASHPAQLFDLVVGWMVLEHLHDPVLALQKLYRWVRPGGWLVISVPNAAALEFGAFKDAWYALQLPTHLYHYTPLTVKALLAHSGWRVCRVLHQRVLTNLVASIGYRLQDKDAQSRVGSFLADYPQKGVLGNVLLYPIAYLLGLLGQTGRMTVWARKIE